MKPVTVMFVCLGNICRSPAAEEILRKKGKDAGMDEYLHVESSGIGDWHLGCLPDSRMRESAFGRGYTLSKRAQKFHPSLFNHYDYILAADQSVLHELQHLAKTPEEKAKIHLMTEYSKPYYQLDVPDPYYNGQAAFEGVLDILESSCEGLIEHIKKQA